MATIAGYGKRHSTTTVPSSNRINVSDRKRRVTLQPTFQPLFRPDRLTDQILDISGQTFGRSSSLEYLIDDARELHKKLHAFSLDLDMDKVGLETEQDINSDSFNKSGTVTSTVFKSHLENNFSRSG